LYSYEASYTPFLEKKSTNQTWIDYIP